MRKFDLKEVIQNLASCEEFMYPPFLICIYLQRVGIRRRGQTLRLEQMGKPEALGLERRVHILEKNGIDRVEISERINQHTSYAIFPT